MMVWYLLEKGSRFRPPSSSSPTCLRRTHGTCRGPWCILPEALLRLLPATPAGQVEPDGRSSDVDNALDLGLRVEAEGHQKHVTPEGVVEENDVLVCVFDVLMDVVSLSFEAGRLPHLLVLFFGVGLSKPVIPMWMI